MCSSLPSCSVLMEDFLKGHDDKELVFEQLPFNHPLFVMYSSGTTGPPKCMVHSQGVSVKGNNTTTCCTDHMFQCTYVSFISA